MIRLAFYKGPPVELKHKITHLGTCLWTWSKYSHAELEIDGVCYSSSARDGGVRSKVIDLTTGRWDIIEIEADTDFALSWFKSHEGCKYDWRNIFRFVLAPIGQDERKYVCFEAVGEMLGFAGAHKLTANDLYEWALAHKK